MQIELDKLQVDIEYLSKDIMHLNQDTVVLMNSNRLLTEDMKAHDTTLKNVEVDLF